MKRSSKSSKNSSPCKKQRFQIQFKGQEAFWILAAVGLWILSSIDSIQLQISCFFLVSAFFLVRFSCSRIRITGFWTLLFVLLVGSQWLQQSEIPQPGLFEITSIRAGYAIAQNGRQKVLLYEPEEYELDQKVELSSFEPVHSLQNNGLFCFSDFLKEKGILYASKNVKSAPGQPDTLRKKVWRLIHKSPAVSLYRLLFYGIADEENMEWIGSLGLPLMALLSILRSILQRYFYAKTAGGLLLAFQGLFLVLFPVTNASLRLFVFSLAGLLFSSWNTRWSCSVISFLLIAPFSGASMSLVLPAGVSFFMHFESDPTRKKLIQLLFCALIQILYLGRLNLVLLCGFTGMRTLLGWGFLLSLPGLWFPLWGSLASKIVLGLQISMDWCTIAGMAPWWYLAGFVSGFWMLVWKWKEIRLFRLLILLGVYPFVWRLDPFFHLYQLDVGQGDAAILVEPFQRSVVMIDAAGRFNHDNASELFLPFLQSRQIHQLDALIVTHADFDHNGAAASLSQLIPVENLVEKPDDLPPLPYPFKLLLEDREIEDLEDKNDQSLISFFAYDGFRFLSMGDASSAIERQLLGRYDLDIDLLKLGHHGSATSSCLEFLEQTSPQLALISSGYQNRYGHPSLEVLNSLDMAGIDRINTADHGMIHFASWHGIGILETGDGLLSFLVPENSK